MERLTITAKDGYSIAATESRPIGAPTAFIQINSATGVPRQFYRHFSAFAAERGFAVVTFDYRGTGESFAGDLKNVRGEVRDWGEQDAAAVTDWCLSAAAGVPLVALGHSVGGQLIGIQPNNRAFARVLNVAAQSGYWALWPAALGVVRRRMWEAVPTLVREYGYWPGKQFGVADLPPGVALSWARWCLSPDYIVDDAGAPLRRFFHEIAAPMTFIAIDDDEIAPLQAVEALMSFYTNAQKSLVRIAPADAGLFAIGHFDIFRPSHSALWPKLLEHLRAHPGEIQA